MSYLASIGYATLVMAAFGGYGLVRYRDDEHASSALMHLGQALASLVFAGYFWSGYSPLHAIPMVATAGYWAWRAWQDWRRRKRRKPSRVLGVVRNLGHRLTVVPVPGGAR